jgi:hypothetical protein
MSLFNACYINNSDNCNEGLVFIIGFVILFGVCVCVFDYAVMISFNYRELRTQGVLGQYCSLIESN